MFKNIFFKSIYVLTAIIIFINTVCVVYQSLFPDINKLPPGVCVHTEASPEGDKVFNVFVVKNNVGCGVRGEVTLKSGEAYNVFWQTGVDAVDAHWADNVHVIVNNTAVNVTDIPYDCRNGISLFAEGVVAPTFIGNYNGEVS